MATDNPQTHTLSVLLAAFTEYRFACQARRERTLYLFVISSQVGDRLLWLLEPDWLAKHSVLRTTRIYTAGSAESDGARLSSRMSHIGRPVASEFTAVYL